MASSQSIQAGRQEDNIGREKVEGNITESTATNIAYSMYHRVTSRAPNDIYCGKIINSDWPYAVKTLTYNYLLLQKTLFVDQITSSGQIKVTTEEPMARNYLLDRWIWPLLLMCHTPVRWVSVQTKTLNSHNNLCMNKTLTNEKKDSIFMSIHLLFI